MTRSRMLCLAAFALFAATWSPARAADAEHARWLREAAATTIVRDDWGIAHVHGGTDADAVFGAIYAEAEDDFNRVEANYITALGRNAEVDGERGIWSDLRMKLFIDPVDLKARYASSPPWLKTLMIAWADGLNFYLERHPAVKPRLITRFEPWMALAFSEGSIGGDVEDVALRPLEAFYGGRPAPPPAPSEARLEEPTGSNGFAIAPSNTASHHALLLINPHTSFFFRAELQMTSDEGLDAYGAATWGQFFLYQGFNPRLGWMHTSSGVDAVDEFAETIVHKDGRLYYRYGEELRPVTVSTIVVPYRAGGALARRTFTVYRTHHGPIVRQAGGKWIAVALMVKPVEALSQSWLRTKARTFADYMKVMAFKANSSNNTILADADGDIAYLHPQFIPRRDDRFDYSKPVDGADPRTDWHGLHALDEAPHLLNPPIGWIMNTNDSPWSAAGPDSPRKDAYPRYMDTAGENMRGLHAAMVLSGKKDFTTKSLLGAAFDPFLPAFARLIPPLLRAWDGLAAADPLKARLADQIALLRGWDDRWGVDSTATTLAVFWGERLWETQLAGARHANTAIYDYLTTRVPPATLLTALADASDRLQREFGSWRTPWGEVNRFQRLTGDIVQPFSDAGASIPVGFTSSKWGSLAAFEAKPYPGTKKWYGTSGNSFVAAVEFGDKVRAVAVTAGGESGDPKSPHFDDQAARYATGNLREVYFYPEQLVGHTERTYHPG